MCRAGTICRSEVHRINPGAGGLPKGHTNLCNKMIPRKATLEKQPPKNPFCEIYQKNFEIPEGRTVYLSRHGESLYNLDERIGGNSQLTDRGQQYATSLGYYFESAGMNIVSL
jgi:hypothetical protein